MSIRGMVLLVTVAAVVFAVASQPAAIVGFCVALLSVPIALAMQAVFFTVGTAFGRWLGPVDVVARTSRGGVEHSSLARTAVRNPDASAGSES